LGSLSGGIQLPNDNDSKTDGGFHAAPVWHLADVSALAYVRFALPAKPDVPPESAFDDA